MTDCKYDIIREGEETILRVDCSTCNLPPSLEDSPSCMANTCERLAETSSVTKIVFSQKRDYEYDYRQTRMLHEIAKVYKELSKKKNLFSMQALTKNPACSGCVNTWYHELQQILAGLLKSDPLGAYVELTRQIRREGIELQRSANDACLSCRKSYIGILRYVMGKLQATKMIALAHPHLAGYQLGDRSAYRRIFVPTIRPDFMFTKLMASFPADGEELTSYQVGDDADVTIFRLADNVQYLYHLMPPEFKLDEDEYELLDQARNIMAEHKPKKSEFVDPERMRQVFFNVGHDLLEELAGTRGISLRNKELNKLTRILVRYTVGFGLIEVLLQDENIQDISINSPLGQIPIFIVHSGYDDCTTNIIPTQTEAESWASKLRMMSGRPLDEANPILDTELELPGASTRVSAITKPLDPSGLAFSFRRHRDRPWTLPLFIKNRMMDSTAAGLLSFLIDGTRSMLIAGTRSSGKSSLLSSLMVEIMRRYRIITVEDTLELPTRALRKLGFNIQPLKVASALNLNTSEMNASDGIRSTLRLGDSSLIIGEVRSKEAVALYEAMRVGAAANVVAGTIHGDSPYGVFDRVVNDIGVPKTSFKATDIIVVANPIKSADGIHRFRRITQITEVRKDWTDDPGTEGGFVDLMKYDAKTDTLQAMDGLTNGDSEILKTVAGNFKDFAGSWDAVWDNIMLRAKIRQTIVDCAGKSGNADLLEAPFVIKCNDKYHLTAERVKEETDSLDPKMIFDNWKQWFDREVKKKK
ncbi:MAG: type II/IV secretion system ATPase subunit [archaeon]